VTNFWSFWLIVDASALTDSLATVVEKIAAPAIKAITTLLMDFIETPLFLTNFFNSFSFPGSCYPYAMSMPKVD
jgi:hypothetical protein